MKISTLTQLSRLCIVSALFTLLSACSALSPKAVEQPSFYSLNGTQGEAPIARPAPAAIAGTLPTLIINPPHATSGFNSQRIVYVRETHKLEYYAHSEWVDTPARMIAPLIVAAVDKSGAFRAVVLTPSAAAGDLRLDTEIIRLQHDLSSQPGRVRFTLRANIVDNTTRKVLAWKEFDEFVAATSETPYGGVVAANRVVQTVFESLALFCKDTAAQWKPDAVAP